MIYWYWCHVKVQVIHLSANKIKYGLVCWWIYSRVRMMKAWAGGRPALSNPTSSPLYKMKNNIIILTVGYSHCFTFPYEYSMSLFWKIFLQFLFPGHVCVRSHSLWTQTPVQVQTRSEKEGSWLHHPLSREGRASSGVHSALPTPDPVSGEIPDSSPSLSNQVLNILEYIYIYTGVSS